MVAPPRESTRKKSRLCCIGFMDYLVGSGSELHQQYIEKSESNLFYL